MDDERIVAAASSGGMSEFPPEAFAGEEVPPPSQVEEVDNRPIETRLVDKVRTLLSHLDDHFLNFPSSYLELEGPPRSLHPTGQRYQGKWSGPQHIRLVGVC